MSKYGEKNIKAYGKNFTTMTPGPFAKWMRTCVIWQAIRFVAINIRRGGGGGGGGGGGV